MPDVSVQKEFEKAGQKWSIMLAFYLPAQFTFTNNVTFLRLSSRFIFDFGKKFRSYETVDLPWLVTCWMVSNDHVL